MHSEKSVGVLIENLHLAFGATQVLQGINLEIQPGELFSFLGPSGSGKSTLLRAIAGFGPTPTGRILIGGYDVAQQPPWKRNVGMVFQSYALWPHLSVRRNVAFGLEERRVAKPEIKKRVEKALEMVGLLAYAERRPSQLSGGQQQRVALARTIVVEPQVLLLDEPLSNLDANLRVQMRREIVELQRALGLTTIFVTHDQEEANTISDRMAVLDQGVLQQVGTPMELYDNPANLFVADFLGTANVLPGRVESDNGQKRFQAEGGVSIPLDSDKPAASGHLLVRPQTLRICPRGDLPEAKEIRLAGDVSHREFLGGLVRYEVTIGQHRLLVDDSHQRGASLFDPGSPVDLLLDARQAVFMAAG